MAAKRKPSPAKKPAAKKPAKTKTKAPLKSSVLGNDPFARGAADRAVAQSAPSAPPPREPLKPTPELQVARGVAPTQRAPAPKTSPPRPVLQKLDEKPKTGSGAPPAPPRFTPPSTAPKVRPTPRYGTPTTSQPLTGPSVTIRPTARTPELVRAPVSSPPVPAAPKGTPAAEVFTFHRTSPSPEPAKSQPKGTPSAEILSGPRPPASSPSVAADPIAHTGAPSAELLNGPRAHASSPSVGADPIAHQYTPSAEVLQGPRAHASSPSVAADPIAHAGTPSAEALEGPRAHASSPSVGADPIAHQHTPSAEVLQGPRAHASSPSVAADPIAHSGTPSAELLTGAHAHASSPPAEFPRGQAPIAHEEIEFEDLPPAPLARPDDAEVTGPTILGALRGLAGALRSAVGLASRASEVDAWGKDKSLAASLRPLGELLYEKYWRVRVEGAEHLPSGPFIIVANHAGALPLDGPVMHLALRKERPDLPEARWLLEDQIFHAPFVGVLANRLGAVRASPENATRLLGEGRPLIVYPEGFHGLSKPFSERYQLRRFGRGGYLKIALRTGVPIVPAAIVGGEESMPLLATLPGGLFGVEYLPLTLPPLPARWHLRFAEPVSLDGAPDEPDHDLAWIERKNLAVRDQIEGMLTDLLQHRESVF